MTGLDLSTAFWRKSSHSSGQGGECVEVADLAPMIAVRDSKNPDGAPLAFPRSTWAAFATRLKSEF